MKINKSDPILMVKLTMFAWLVVVGLMIWVSLTPGLGATAGRGMEPVASRMGWR